jgi:dual specificity protein kinase YAK1
MIGNKIGSGSFGYVHESLEDKNHVYKIIGSKYKNYISNEVDILKKIKNKPYFCQLLNNFEKDNSIYLKFNKYYCNLYQYKKDLTQNEILSISFQILEGLEYLNFLGIVHCDLKPENLMFENSDCKHIKIIDFGSSIFMKDRDMYYNYIQTRWYCSPDVILGYPITTDIDVWSLGCIIYELLNKKPLFQGKKALDTSRKYQLYKMIEVLGLPSEEYLSKCKLWGRYFTYKRTLIPKDNYYNLIKELNKCGEEIELKKRNLDDEVLNSDILKLIKEMLKYEQRLTIEELKVLNKDLFLNKKIKL